MTTSFLWRATVWLFSHFWWKLEMKLFISLLKCLLKPLWIKVTYSDILLVCYKSGIWSNCPILQNYFPGVNELFNFPHHLTYIWYPRKLHAEAKNDENSVRYKRINSVGPRMWVIVFQLIVFIYQWNNNEWQGSDFFWFFFFREPLAFIISFAVLFDLLWALVKGDTVKNDTAHRFITLNMRQSNSYHWSRWTWINEP